ncbi:MAG: M24 family metallopeptidase, partial [Coriobacteriales bacterium]|nr:M24 family metallopeptidase [Coriobacteriales bacterium]
DFIHHAGYEGRFGHGLGHSLGLDIHEEPRFNTVSEATLEAGFVMTDEPGVYLPGRCGCRIEDTVLVTPDGCRRLTTAAKELIIL